MYARQKPADHGVFTHPEHWLWVTTRREKGSWPPSPTVTVLECGETHTHSHKAQTDKKRQNTGRSRWVCLGGGSLTDKPWQLLNVTTAYGDLSWATWLYWTQITRIFLVYCVDQAGQRAARSQVSMSLYCIIFHLLSGLRLIFPLLYLTSGHQPLLYLISSASLTPTLGMWSACRHPPPHTLSFLFPVLGALSQESEETGP